MAKKVVARIQTGKDGKGITKIIKMVRSPKTGAYIFKEKVVSAERVKEALKELK